MTFWSRLRDDDNSRLRTPLDRVGAFRGSRIGWAGASSVPAELAHLVSQLNDALTAQGFPTDPRPFHAHVTLARRCRRAAGMGVAAPITWRVDGMTLNASELATGGSRYRELAGWPLSTCLPLKTR